MLLVSPILNRELVTFLRKKMAFGGLLLYLAILGAAFGICWWETLSFGRANDRDVLSRNLFHTIAVAQLLIFSAYALILTCTKINGERDEKTLDLLVSAPLTSVHIVLAKYVSALTVVLLLVVASAPILSLCFLLGGVSGREVLSAYAIILLAVLAYGMVGMACSTICSRNYVSLIAGFVMVLLCYFGFALICAALLSWVNKSLVRISMDPIIFWVFQTTSPMVIYLALITPGFPPTPFSAGVGMALHAAFQASVWIVSFLAAWRGFRAMAGRTSEAYRRRELRRSLRSRKRKGRGAGAAVATHPRPSRRYRPTSDRVNPVYARENRHFFSRRWKHRIVRYVLAAGAFLTFWHFFEELFGGSRSYSFDNFMCFLGVATAIIAGVFVPLLAARTVTSERETDSLSLLILTPLRPSQVLLGKMAVVVRHSYGLVLLFTFLIVISSAGWMTNMFQLLGDWIKILLPLFMILLYFTSVGLFFSVVCRRTVTAIVLAYATIVTLAFTPLFVGILEELSHWNRYSDPASESIKNLVAFIVPLFSPGFYFVPEQSLNLWHENHHWGSILGYSFWMFLLCAAIFVAAESIFAQKYYRGVRHDTRLG
jgi:ABC-type transport system involved in multi-copper enzyme maturation permease subunit